MYGVQLLTSIASETSLREGFLSILNSAKSASRRWLAENIGTYQAKEVFDCGLTVQVFLEMSINKGFLCVEAESHKGNLNTPFSVLQACLLDVIRSSFRQDFPLNSGFLDCWEIQTNPGSKTLIAL